MTTRTSSADRPRIHFVAPEGCTGAPCGLSRFRGEFHLFYRTSRGGDSREFTAWGHAVSQDLATWEDAGVAIAPDAAGAIGGGSAVVDWNNSSGLSRLGEPVLAAIYTRIADGYTQCLAASEDGKAFIPYASNPVVETITPRNRDPRVFWHDASRQWIMALYAGYPESVAQSETKTPIRQTFQLLTSPNLIDWSRAGEAAGFYETPDMFPLALDGDSSQIAWIVMGADGGYRVGEFDGRRFKPATRLLRSAYGGSYWAPQTFSELDDDRRIQMAWLHSPRTSDAPRSSLTAPAELRLVSTAEGPRLARRPAVELHRRRTTAATTLPTPAPLAEDPIRLPGGDALDIEASFTVSRGTGFELTVHGVEIVYDGGSQTLAAGDISGGPVKSSGGAVDLRIIADTDFVEIFAGRGLTFIAVPAIAQTGRNPICMRSRAGRPVVLEYGHYILG